MIVSIHQPNFLPWSGYFHRISESDIHVVLDNVQFEKNSFINRNRIKTSFGWMWLTVPVLTKGRFGESINAVLIDSRNRWQEKMWKSIWLNYSRARFFKNYANTLEAILMKSWSKLIDLNVTLFHFLLDALDLKPKIVYASDMGHNEKKSDLVLAMCKNLGADIYFSGSLGKGYLEEKKFEENKIKIVYQQYRHPAYRQLFGDFISDLSVIDLLFNCGPESLSIIKEGQEKLKGNSNGSC